MIISSEKLVLRYYRPEDVEPIFRGYTGDVESATFLAREPHLKPAQTEKMLCALSNSDSHALTGKRAWIVHAVQENIAVGLLTFIKENKSTIVHFGIGAPYRGRGYASEALALAAQYFLNANHTIVSSFTDTENTPAQTALVRAGFVRTGKLKNFYKAPQFNGEYRDVFCYQYGA